MSSDIGSYLRGLRKRGYTIDQRGSGHLTLRWKGERVATTTGSRACARSLSNLKAQVRRFERSLV